MGAGCAQAGGGDQGDPAATSSLPTCSDVWVDGGTLPQGYRGCTDEDGQVATPVTLACADGDVLMMHDDRFFAAPGGEIIEAAVDSTEYEQAFKACTGA